MRSRREFLQTSGFLIVSGSALAVEDLGSLVGIGAQGAGPYLDPDFRQLDSWIVIRADNTATFFVGKTDLGQGTGTAFRQIMADELDIAFENTTCVMGSTDVTVDQGGSGGSDALQADGYPMRRVAAEARRVLLEMASEHFGVGVSELHVSDAVVSVLSAGSRLPAPGSRQPIVLYVGSIFERRRVDKLIEAFDLMAAQVPGATLEIVGENRTRRPRLDLDALRSRTSHPDRIHIRSYVDDETLRGLYQKATVLAFLSEYEGFGFTPLEALAAGVAPLVLDTPIARETCADAARYVPPAAPPAHVAQVMTELLTSAPARREILQRAETVLSRYDWDLAAGDTLKVLEEAALGR